MLGGVESPAWPSQPRAMGTIFDGADALMSASKLTYDVVGHALTLEWWGVQHWRVYRGNSRWTVTADCPPLLTSEHEHDLQHCLNMLTKGERVGTPFSYVTQTSSIVPIKSLMHL